MFSWKEFLYSNVFYNSLTLIDVITDVVLYTFSL